VYVSSKLLLVLSPTFLYLHPLKRTSFSTTTYCSKMLNFDCAPSPDDTFILRADSTATLNPSAVSGSGQDWSKKTCATHVAVPPPALFPDLHHIDPIPMSCLTSATSRKVVRKCQTSPQRTYISQTRADRPGLESGSLTIKAASRVRCLLNVNEAFRHQVLFSCIGKRVSTTNHQTLLIFILAQVHLPKSSAVFSLAL
jgi:hypothetical protein